MENTRISHYAIGRLLGRGGMGEVYEAVDLDLDRRVALKFIAPELSADAESARRFEREARSAASLSHPHIATLYAYERDGRSAFIAMELMSGESLRDRMAAGPMALDSALGIARDVASALGQAHRRGIVHRDIKPENLMFDLDGVPKVTDFGLARAAHASRMTMTGTTLGTAAYMAPESVRGAVGAPGDVFALGVMLHEMLAGALPFPGDNPIALLYMIANEPPAPLSAARPDVPPAIEAIVSRMLDKNPETRPDAPTVARELAAMTGVTLPVSDGPGPLASNRNETQELEVERLQRAGHELVETPVPRRPRRRSPMLVALVPVALIVAGLAAWNGRRMTDERRTRAVPIVNEAVALLQRGEAAAARARLEQALKLDSSNGPARVSLANLLHRAGEDERAQQLVGGLAEDRRQSAATRALAHLVQADIDMDAGAWPSAVNHAFESLALDSSSAYPYNQLAYALVHAGRPNDAKRVLLRAMPTFTNEPALHKNMGLAQLALGETGPAWTEANIALDQRANYAPAVGLRARVLARQGKPIEALAEWDHYLELNPAPQDSAEVAEDLAARGVLR